MNRLDGKIAVVTGGTSGIGAASSLLFAEAGAFVIVGGRDKDRGKKVVDEIVSRGLNATYINIDVKDNNSITQFAQNVYNQFGRVDILFNNAGIFPVAPAIENFDRDECNDVFNVNITSMILVTNAFLTYLINNHGVILNNASIAGLQHFASGQSYAYSSSKASVIQFTRMMAKKYGEHVRVNCICPGVTDTPLYKSLDSAKFSERIPVKRVGVPSDIAKAATFLVSDDASYINGAVLVVDGGLTL